jgi:C_GCAxxG_C_C family probable redox protein
MTSREELINEARDKAFRYEAERGSCPQCVLAAIMETFQIGDKKTIQAADALAGGTGLTTEGTCGALVGGLLALSSALGRTYDDFSQGKRKRRVFSFAHKLCEQFKREYGSILCKDIHQKLFGRTFNLLDTDDYAAFEAAGGHVDKCPGVSGKVAEWTAQLLLDKILEKYP